MTNDSTASWEKASRTAVISLADVTHNGDVYLANAWMGHGIAVSAITFVLASPAA